MKNTTGLGIACALGATLFYGLVPNLVKGGLQHGVPAVESITFRTFFITVALALLTIVRGETFIIPRQARAAFAGQAVATLIVSVGYLASVQFIPVGLAAIIFFTFPVLIMLAAPMVEGHAPGLLRIAIAIVAFSGLALSVGPTFDQLDIRGILLAATASAACTVQFFSGRSLSHYMPPAAFGSLVHLAIFPATFLIAVWVGGGKIAFFPGGTAQATGLAFMAGVGLLYVGGYLSHMLSLRFAAASTVAPFYNLEPMIATGVAVLVFGERMAWNQYAGGALVLAALVAAGWAGARKDRSA